MVWGFRVSSAVVGCRVWVQGLGFRVQGFREVFRA